MIAFLYVRALDHQTDGESINIRVGIVGVREDLPPPPQVLSHCAATMSYIARELDWSKK